MDLPNVQGETTKIDIQRIELCYLWFSNVIEHEQSEHLQKEEQTKSYKHFTYLYYFNITKHF